MPWDHVHKIEINETNKQINFIDDNKSIYCLLPQFQYKHTRTYKASTIKSLERTNDACLKVFEMHDSESKAVKIVWVELKTIHLVHILLIKLYRISFCLFYLFGRWVDCDVLIKTTGWISKMLKLFTSLKLEIEPKQLVLHFWRAIECACRLHAQQNRNVLAICTLEEIRR